MASTWLSLFWHTPWEPWANMQEVQLPWSHCSGAMTLRQLHNDRERCSRNPSSASSQPWVSAVRTPDTWVRKLVAPKCPNWYLVKWSRVEPFSGWWLVGKRKISSLSFQVFLLHSRSNWNTCFNFYKNRHFVFPPPSLVTLSNSHS